MKRIIIFIVALLMFINIKGYAQVKPAQSQYLKEKGVFVNPGFEQGYKGWTISGCTKSREVDLEAFGYSLKLVCTAETFSVKQESTALAGTNLDGFAGCKVKADAAGVKARILANAVGQPETAITGTDYNRFEEEFTADATSNGLEVYADAAFTGTVYIEDCRIGFTPDAFNTSVTVNAGDMIYNNGSGDTNLPPGTEDQVLKMNASNLPVWATLLNGVGNLLGFDGTNLVQFVACANGEHIVWDDSVAIGFKCTSALSGTLNPVTDWEPVTLTTTDPGSISSQDIYKKRIGDTIHIKGRINFSGPLTTGFSVTHPETFAVGQQPITQWGGASFNPAGQGIMGDAFVGSTSTVFRFLRQDSGNNNAFNLGNTWPQVVANGDYLQFKYSYKVEGWTSGSPAAAQNKNLTALTANRLTGHLVNTNGTYAFEDFGDKSFTVTSSGTGVGSIDYSSLGLISAPNLNGGYEGATSSGNIRILEFRNITATGADYDMKAKDATNPNNVFFNGTFSFSLIKTGVDVNKSQVIAGTFENINSSDLYDLYVNLDAALSIPNATNTTLKFNNEKRDDHNLYNPATGIATLKKNTCYIVGAGYLFSGSGFSSYANIIRKVGGVTATDVFNVGSNGVNGNAGTALICGNTGDTFELEVYQGSGSSQGLQSAGNGSFMWAKEMPDYEAVVENLSDNTTKCQNKILSADIGVGTVDIADLRYTNLPLSTKFRVCLNSLAQSNIAAVDNIGLQAYHNGSQIMNVVNSFTGVAEANSTSGCLIFTTAATTLTFDAASISAGNFLRGDGTTNETFVELCQLPSSYIIGNDW